MAKIPIRNTFGCPVIERFIEDLEKTIDSSPIVLSSGIQKDFSPDAKTVYLRGNIIFINSSCLEIAIFAREIRNSIAIDKYRYHYMNGQKQMIFRYDNAPHHPEISSHPHHKHKGDTVSASSLPNLKDIMNEISAIMLRK